MKNLVVFQNAGVPKSAQVKQQLGFQELKKYYFWCDGVVPYILQEPQNSSDLDGNMNYELKQDIFSKEHQFKDLVLINCMSGFARLNEN